MSITIKVIAYTTLAASASAAFFWFTLFSDVTDGCQSWGYGFQFIYRWACASTVILIANIYVLYRLEKQYERRNQKEG